MYASVEIMNSDYQDTFTAEQIDPGTGSCEDPGVTGRLRSVPGRGRPWVAACVRTSSGFPTVYWTDDRVFI